MINPKEGLFYIGFILAIFAFNITVLRPLDKFINRKQEKLIKCDLCKYYMYPDGLHIIDIGFIFPNRRIFRHPVHIIRTKILKKPIIDQRLKTLRERRKSG